MEVKAVRKRQKNTLTSQNSTKLRKYPKIASWIGFLASGKDKGQEVVLSRNLEEQGRSGTPGTPGTYQVPGTPGQ